MQVSKVAVVATGALATAAVMGSTPAFAAESAGISEVVPATIGLLDYEGRHRASDAAMRQLAEHWLAVAPEQTGSAPSKQILSAGNGSAISAGAVQQCGSTGSVAAGVTVPVDSPATVAGSCNNGNQDVAGGDSDALVSILNGSAVSALALQTCGSNGSILGGVTAPIGSPATVAGDCNNGNIDIHGAEGTDALFSALDGSAASVAALQTCGSNSGGILGVTAPIASPATSGGCNNGNLSVR